LVRVRVINEDAPMPVPPCGTSTHRNTNNMNAQGS
jgi:hypothetical protein